MFNPLPGSKRSSNPSLTNMLRCAFSPGMSRLNLRTPAPEGASS
jgi:hypothetical protein